MPVPRVRSFVPALAVLTAGCMLAHALIAGLVISGIARGQAVGDWTAFYAAARIVWEGNGAALYDPAVQAATQRTLFGPGEPFAFTQPAFVAIALSPLGALSYTASFWAWFGVNLAVGTALLAGGGWATREWPPRQRMIFLGLAAVSPPAVALFLNGQLDLFVLAGLAGCYALQKRGHQGAAGAALGLALVKPQLVAGAVLLLAVRRQWRALVTFGAAGAALLLAPAAALGASTIADQARLLTSFAWASQDFRVNAAMMANVRGAVVSLTGSGSPLLWGPPFAVVAATAIAVAVARWRRPETTPEAAWALAFLLPLLVSPHLHIQSLVLLVPFALLYLDARRQAGAREDGDFLLGGYAAMSLLWVTTIAGFAALFAAPLLAFTAAARAWPSGHAEARPEPLRRAA
jgi:hypothetical protein